MDEPKFSPGQRVLILFDNHKFPGTVVHAIPKISPAPDEIFYLIELDGVNEYHMSELVDMPESRLIPLTELARLIYC